MKKYIVYYEWNAVEEGTRCNHNFTEFDTLQEAAEYLKKLGYAGHTHNTTLSKNIAIKTIYEEYEIEKDN